MSRAVTVTCDGPGCHQVKREANNWWIVRKDRYGLHSFTVWPMSRMKHDDLDIDIHICSHKCLHAVLEDFMQYYNEAAQKDDPRVEVIDIKQ